MKIKKLGIFSFAKFQALLTGLLGLVAGILYSIGGFFIDLFVTLGWLSSITFETPGLSYGTILAMGALVGMPAIAAVFGFAAGIIEALLFNLFVGFFGGIELDIK